MTRVISHRRRRFPQSRNPSRCTPTQQKRRTRPSDTGSDISNKILRSAASPLHLDTSAHYFFGLTARRFDLVPSLSLTAPKGARFQIQHFYGHPCVRGHICGLDRCAPRATEEEEKATISRVTTAMSFVIISSCQHATHMGRPTLTPPPPPASHDLSPHLPPPSSPPLPSPLHLAIFIGSRMPSVVYWVMSVE